MLCFEIKVYCSPHFFRQKGLVVQKANTIRAIFHRIFHGFQLLLRHFRQQIFCAPLPVKSSLSPVSHDTDDTSRHIYPTDYNRQNQEYERINQKIKEAVLIYSKKNRVCTLSAPMSFEQHVAEVILCRSV